MSESFFQRWSRRKTEQSGRDRDTEQRTSSSVDQAPALHPPNSLADIPEQPLPTLEDVAHLTRESDYSMFVSKGVDQNVRRAAMKKLFSDPHFNAMDGLDIYIDDYTKPSPLTPAMLAALQHTQSMFAAVEKNEREREEREKAQRIEAAGESQHIEADDAQPEAVEPDETEQDHAAAQPVHASLPMDHEHAMPGRTDEPGESMRLGG